MADKMNLNDIQRNKGYEKQIIHNEVYSLKAIITCENISLESWYRNLKRLF